MSQLFQRKWFGLGFRLKSSYRGRGDRYDREVNERNLSRYLSSGQNEKIFQKIARFQNVQVNFYLQTKKFSLKIETKSNFSWEFAWAFCVLLSESQYSKGTPITYIGVPFEY